MKKTLFMFVALATFIVSAQAYAYTWTDFSKTRIKYRISGYSSADAAQAAAVQSLAGLEEGVLPSAHMFQSDRDKCRDINSSKSKRAMQVLGCSILRVSTH